MSGSNWLIAAIGLRWVGRGLAVLLFLFWGAFFVEHLSEWFFDPRGFPPPWLWFCMALHFGMIAGLALSVWKEWPGVAVTVIATVGFFSSIGMHRFPWLALLNALPAACFLLAWELRSLAGAARAAHPG